MITDETRRSRRHQFVRGENQYKFGVIVDNNDGTYRYILTTSEERAREAFDKDLEVILGSAKFNRDFYLFEVKDWKEVVPK